MMEGLSPDFFGTEFDWFARDREGFVALMSSAGGSQFPALLAPMESEIDAVLDSIGINYRSPPWAQALEFGLYAYDADMYGGPYERKGTPKSPRPLQDLPDEIRALAELVTIDGRLRKLTSVTPALFLY